MFEKYWHKLKHTIHKHAHRKFNIKMGAIAGVITGTIVFFINYDYGLFHAILAFVKQFMFNFFMASYNTKLIERLVYSIKNSFFAVAAAGILPTILATSVVFAVHWLGHTPQAWESSYWQAFFNLPIFLLTGLMYQTGIERRFKLLRVIFTTKSSRDDTDYYQQNESDS
jgi:hypothetical protein